MSCTEIVPKLIIKDNKLEDIKGQDPAKLQIKSALLSNRHILIMGRPGMGKTSLAKNIAKLLPELVVNECAYHCIPQQPICPTCKQNKQNEKQNEKSTSATTAIKTKKITGLQRFVRVQGSPDLTVEDLLGDIDPIKALKFGPLSMEAFTPGKIFKANNGVLFFDEINRCPEKLQNALLQVLEERKATIGSYDLDIPAHFVLIATMNPHDTSTETLSEVLLDRFDVVMMTYPENEVIEADIVKEKGKRMENILFPEPLLYHLIAFVRDLRENTKLETIPSVRASLGLYERAQANAYLKGKKEVSLDDVESAIFSVLSHRIKLKPSVEYLKTPQEFLQEEYNEFKKDNQDKIQAFSHQKSGYL